MKKYNWKAILYRCTPGRISFNRNLHDVENFDKVYGTNFAGRISQAELGVRVDQANDYSPSPDKILIKTLKNMLIEDDISIVDMGCGKGYAMYIMAKFPFRKIGGVELSRMLSDIAEDNLKKTMPHNMKWEVNCSDAILWNKYDEYDIFYIYNSFPEGVIHEVNENICESVKRRKRPVKVLYLCPEFPEEFAADLRWKLVKRGSIFQLRHGMHVFQHVEMY